MRIRSARIDSKSELSDRRGVINLTIMKAYHKFSAFLAVDNFTLAPPPRPSDHHLEMGDISIKSG